MTTILDPLGSPTIIYNNSGRNMQSLVANSGNSFGTATLIPHVSEETIVFANASGGAGNGAVYFDSAFEIGDTVVIRLDGGSAMQVYDSAGNNVDLIGSPAYAKYIWQDPFNSNWRRIG